MSKILLRPHCLLFLSSRRRVDNGTCPNYESTFSLGFSSSTNATINMSCSNQWTGDACIDALDLYFPPGHCSLTVRMELAQDQTFETREQLLMYITNCSNCISNVTSTQPVEIIIDDTDDCKYSKSSTIPHAHVQCMCGGLDSLLIFKCKRGIPS